MNAEAESVAYAAAAAAEYWASEAQDYARQYNTTNTSVFVQPKSTVGVVESVDVQANWAHEDAVGTYDNAQPPSVFWTNVGTIATGCAAGVLIGAVATYGASLVDSLSIFATCGAGAADAYEH